MKILLIHRYFWPDTPPYAIILKKIATRLAGDGHDVDVLSTQPAYKPDANISKQKTVEQIDGYKVLRLGLLPEFGGKPIIKALNMFFFCFRIVFYVLRHRYYDVIMISTSPPIVAGLSARVSAKLCGAQLLYHCMDIHPEIGRISGEFSNKRFFGILKDIDSKTCRYAKRVIVLSDDMKQAIIDRGNNGSCNIEVIQNFSFDGESNPTIAASNKFAKKKGVFRLIFAGNIGRFQGLDMVVDTFIELPNRDNIELIFLGDGKMTSFLKKKVADANVSNIHFIQHQPITVANGIIKTADLGIVSLCPGIYRYAYPTKIIAYLSVGCPLLVMVEKESSLVSFLKQYDIGISLDIDDKPSLKIAISELSSNRKKLEQMRANATVVYKKVYHDELVLNKWSSLINSIEDQ